MEPLEFVMLMDQDHESNKQGKALLEEMGFAKKVIVKNSGKEGIEYIHELLDAGGKCPELIFMDINMPITGGVVFLYEFEKIVEDLNACTKVVVTSVHKKQRNLQHFLGAGQVMGFVYKPYVEISLARIHRTYQNFLR